MTGFESAFHIKMLVGRLHTLSALDRSVGRAIPTDEDAIEVVKTLYRIGALGNRYYVKGAFGKREWRYGWVFRDNVDPVIDREFIVHESLRKTLQLSFKI